MQIKQWYAVYTKPKKENYVLDQLSDKLITAYNPLIKKVTKRSGSSGVLSPLFPCYIFVNMALDSDCYRVKWTPGVKGILGYGHMPVPISDDVISLIKVKSGKKGYIQPKYTYKKNDRVRIKSGRFAGLEGVFDNYLSDKGRVRIFMNFVSYQAAIQLDVWEIEGMCAH